MKILHILPLALIYLFLVGCQDNGSKPSIKDNSTRDLMAEKTEDFSGIPSEKLHKHILAHYDLGQYKLGSEKLKALTDNRPDLIDSLDLKSLKMNFEDKLLEIKSQEDAIAEKERKLRMPNATKNMKISKKGNISYYMDNSSPEFDSTESFYAYFTKSDTGVVKLYLKIRYIGTDWLDIEKYIITVDQLDYNLDGTVEKIETKGKKRYKHEVLDVEIDSAQKLTLLNAVANGDQVNIVYVGESSYKEREVTEEKQLAVRNVIDAYLFLGGMDFKNLKDNYTNGNDSYTNN